MTLLAGLSLLAGCGFHLRAAIDLAPELARVYVTGADRDLAQHLGDALALRGALVIDDPEAGATHIDLLEARFERKVLTTNAQGRASAYTLYYRITFRVTGGDGTPLQSDTSIALQRAFDYHHNRELQAEQEVRFLETDLRREAVRRMLQRLARLSSQL